MESIRFKGDSATRRRFFVAESFAHPAKMASGLFLECLERYSKPGDVVLDVMAGSGTSLLGAMYGRSLILNELELHFVLPMLASWKKIQQNGPAMGYAMGGVLILRGDARCLPLPDASVGAAITSPPYEGSLQGDEPAGKLFETERRVNSPASGNRKSFRKPLGQGYSKLQARADRVAKAQGLGARNVFQEALDNPRAVSRRGYEYGYTRPVDAIVTSPPYEAMNTGEGPGAAGPNSGMWTGKIGGYSSSASGYTRPVDAIVASPPYEGIAVTAGDQARSPSIVFPKGERTDRGKIKRNGLFERGYSRPVDAIVTSPPFKETRPFASPISGRSTADYSRISYEKRGFLMGNEEYQKYLATCNVGNLRGQAYWDSMAKIYAECWRVLKPGGIMALVLKGYTRDGKYVDLPGQTEALLLEAGWVKHDEWRRELWSLSFWRILQKRRDPVAWDDRLMYEDVLAFRKPR